MSDDISNRINIDKIKRLMSVYSPSLIYSQGDIDFYNYIYKTNISNTGFIEVSYDILKCLEIEAKNVKLEEDADILYYLALFEKSKISQIEKSGLISYYTLAPLKYGFENIISKIASDFI